MKLINVISTFTVLFLLMVFPNCNKDPYRPFDFKIYLDSILLADTIQYGDTLNIKCYGVVGPDGCHAFKHFETEFTQNNILITVIGIHSGGPVCPAVWVYLDGEILQLKNLTRGTYTIITEQPDNNELRADVVVE